MGAITVLLVEDDDESRCALEEVLVDEDFKVIATETAEAAWDLLSGGFVPDVLVADYVLPGETGDALLRRCRADPQLAAIPAIMISGLDRESVQLSIGRPLGTRRFLGKPLDIVQLVNAIMEAAVFVNKQ